MGFSEEQFAWFGLTIGIGAFMLYGSFITLFVNILNILGIMRQN